MEKFSFTVWGHEHMRAAHRNTLEFTKEDHLTRQGDCIIGVRADAEEDNLKKFLRPLGGQRIIIGISAPEIGVVESVRAVLNPLFIPGPEMVIRKGDFRSSRTLATHADKAAADIDRKLAAFLSDPSHSALVTFSPAKSAE